MRRPDALQHSVMAKRRLLGIDYGRARIGIAVCDELHISIKPIGFVARESDRQAAHIVKQLAADERVEGIVFGLPLHSHGDEGESVKWVRAFMAELKSSGLEAMPMYEVDERYTSEEAEAFLKDQGEWPAEPGVIDARAACIILKRYITGET